MFATVSPNRLTSSPFSSYILQRNAAPKVFLSSRSVIEKLDSGLYGIKGAKQIISSITSRRLVTKLILGHNSLCDSGCIELFQFLSSPEGKKYRIKEISLNANEIGDRGLEAIAMYLDGNTELMELFLQDNRFTPNPHTINIFTNALNNSHLKLLSLVSNSTLSDDFAQMFLPKLCTPYLNELHLSTIGLTAKSVNVLVKFVEDTAVGLLPGQQLNNSDDVIRGTRSLQILKLNGNRLSLRGIKKIIDAVGRKGYGIMKLECYANAVNHIGQSVQEDMIEEDVAVEGNAEQAAAEPQLLLQQGYPNGLANEHITPTASTDKTWQNLERELMGYLLRNDLLKRRTGEQAARLLSVSRCLLMKSRKWNGASVKGKEKEGMFCPRFADDGVDMSIGVYADVMEGANPLEENQWLDTFPWRLLPTELQLQTLAYLAPSLSSSQLARVFNYAADRNTLPPLLPSLLSNSSCGYGWGQGARRCIADPMRIPSDFTRRTSDSSVSFNIIGENTLSNIPMADPLSSPVAVPPSPQGAIGSTFNFSNANSCTGGCASGQCMGRANSVVCRKDQERAMWLKMVGCERYEDN